MNLEGFDCTSSRATLKPGRLIAPGRSVPSFTQVACRQQSNPLALHDVFSEQPVVGEVDVPEMERINAFVVTVGTCSPLIK